MGGRLPPAIVIAALLAVIVPLALKYAGVAMTQTVTTVLLLGIIVVAFLIERIFWRK